jgi:hypothetical protein
LGYRKYRKITITSEDRKLREGKEKDKRGRDNKGIKQSRIGGG